MVALRLAYAVLFAAITMILGALGGFLSGKLAISAFSVTVGPWTLDDRQTMLLAVTLLTFAILAFFHTILAFVTWNLCLKRRKYDWVQFLSALDALVLPLGTIIGLKTLSWLADEEVKNSFS